MRAFEVMSTSVQTVEPDTAADAAWNLMRQKGIRHLIVLRNREIVGIVSERDVGGRHGATARAGRTVGDLMTSHAVTVSPETTIRSVANVMRGRTIGCVPVTTGRRLEGIITVSDLLDLLGRGTDRPARQPRRSVHSRGPHRNRKRQIARTAW